MADEFEIRDAQTEEIKAENITPRKNSMADFYIELVLILILGVLVGYAVKTEAAKHVTIGFNDYQMKLNPGQYDINALQAGLADKNNNPAANQDPNNGATCTNSDPNSSATGN